MASRRCSGVAAAERHIVTRSPVSPEANLAVRIAHHVPLEAEGDNLRGSCPLHPDVSRSLYVLRRRPVFHCFGCGASGGHDAWSAVLART